MPDFVWVIFRRATRSAPLSGPSPQHARRGDVLEWQATAGRDLLPADELLQRCHGRMHDVDRIVRAEGLGEHVVDAGALEHGAHRTAGDDAGTRARRLQQHDTGRLLALHRVRDRRLDPRNLEEVLLGLLDTLGDRGRHLLGLAVSDADGAVTVADHHEGSETEPATALDDLRDPIDGHHPFEVRALLRRAAVATTPAAFAAVATLPVALAAARAGPPLVSRAHQNSNPASRAASANAAIRPVYVLPPRSKTALVTPATLAASAWSAPSCLACAVLSPSVSLYVEADARVTPRLSSTS